jgi:hypothetical protein
MKRKLPKNKGKEREKLSISSYKKVSANETSKKRKTFQKTLK